MPSLKRILHSGINIAFPAVCEVCGIETADEQSELICRDCVGELANARNPCPRCAYPNHVLPGIKRAKNIDLMLSQEFAAEEAARIGCVQCFQSQLQFDRAFSLGSYQGKLRETVLRMKHSSEERLSRAVGTILGREINRAQFHHGIDLIVPIPSHWIRRFSRGYNVAESVAQSVAAETGVARCDSLLRSLRKTSKQGTLTAGQRADNVRGAFGVNPNIEIGRINVLLVDDVMTTGSTLNEAARILRRAGAMRVDIAIVVRATGVS